jgi:2Fe-2S ferredoxin
LPRVTFIQPNGTENAVDAKSQVSLMEAAIAHNVPGIEAECYGACNCGTCHVYVDASWREATGGRGEWEGEVLDSLPLVRENSRLSCQITMRDDLDGLTVRLPAYQGVEPK